ncbi:hypothetical protein [Deinococcus radiotolerans]|uniref:hypothetical protein n=1 Tax=Deinococcus radiotolerans TaxID=1309407 RepID=UPI001667DE56|nr:hypothetical protein [Deinococcus radiotolerans]
MLVDILMSMTGVGVAAFPLSGLAEIITRAVVTQEPGLSLLAGLNLTTVGVLLLLGLGVGAARVRAWIVVVAFMTYPLAWVWAQSALGNMVSWAAPVGGLLVAVGATILTVLAGAVAGRTVRARRVRRT